MVRTRSHQRAVEVELHAAVAGDGSEVHPLGGLHAGIQFDARAIGSGLHRQSRGLALIEIDIAILLTEIEEAATRLKTGQRHPALNGRGLQGIKDVRRQFHESRAAVELQSAVGGGRRRRLRRGGQAQHNVLHRLGIRGDRIFFSIFQQHRPGGTERAHLP